MVLAKNPSWFNQTLLITNTKIMDYLFCGIDISKDTLDYAYCFSADQKITESFITENTEEKIKEMVKELMEQAESRTLWVCFEHTGHYGFLLSHVLAKMKIKFSAVSSLEIMKSIGLTRGKTDAVDARRIARYLAAHNYKLAFTKLPDKKILKMKSLLSIRDQFVRIRTQIKNARKALVISSQSLPLRAEIKIYDREVIRFDKKVSMIEKMINEIIKSDNSLLKNFTKIKKVTGIGPIVGAYLIVSTNNFTSFENPRKYNCYCGLAPFEHSSGTSVKRRTKTSRFRNKEMKNMLFHAANSAIIHDAQLHTYFNRKVGEGKHKMSVINAVACKIIYRVFAVVKREEDFVKLSM